MPPFLKELFTDLLAFFVRFLNPPKQPKKPSSSSPPSSLPSSTDFSATTTHTNSVANPLSATDQQAAQLQKEIRDGRKFTLAEAIGREGGSFMKGESAIPRPLRAKNTINQFITEHLTNPSSALSTTLQTWTNNDIRIMSQLDTPLVALSQILESTLTEPTAFCEFARQVAIAQSQLTGDRPYFQTLNGKAHPEADYTHESIQGELSQLLKTLEDDACAP
ncbi:MAG: hypothetical protein AAGC93_07125 [Cyanobacteria bacterium P01_F01_bin.53]